MRSTQIPLFSPETEWVMPEELKDLKGYKKVAIDLETNDPNLKDLGSGNVAGEGHIAGIAVAVEGWSCLLYTSPSPRDGLLSRMPSSA